MSKTCIQLHRPDYKNEWDCQCARCGSSLDWNECYACCGDGFIEDEFNGESGYSNCCECDGEGFFSCCLSSWKWCKENPLPGRENQAGDVPEWFQVCEKNEGTNDPT